MKVLLVTQYFYPENFKSNDIASELIKRGYDVTVLTGLPNYPEGKIYDNYGFFKKNKENYFGAKVKRAWLIPRGKGSGVRLFLNYFSWAFFASLYAVYLGFKEKYDVIIVHEPSPITQGFPAIVVKKIQKIPILFWVLDLWPESLKSAGGIKNKHVLGFFSRIVKYIYKKSDKILISSRSFKNSINERGIEDNKIIYFPNWAEDIISKGNTTYPIPTLPEGFKLIFAGNIGSAQDIETVMETALILKNNSQIKFIIIGDGRKKNNIENFVKSNKLENTVHLLGRYPIESMKSFFNQADGLLVTLKDELIFNLTVPAKLQAYMSAGKPILGMLNGEGASVIKQAGCGLVSDAGIAEKYADTILQFYKMDESRRKEMGINGYNYYVENFDITNCMNNLSLIIKSTTNLE